MVQRPQLSMVKRTCKVQIEEEESEEESEEERPTVTYLWKKSGLKKQAKNKLNTLFVLSMMGTDQILIESPDTPTALIIKTSAIMMKKPDHLDSITLDHLMNLTVTNTITNTITNTNNTIKDHTNIIILTIKERCLIPQNMDPPEADTEVDVVDQLLHPGSPKDQMLPLGVEMNLNPAQRPVLVNPTLTQRSITRKRFMGGETSAAPRTL